MIRNKIMIDGDPKLAVSFTGKTSENFFEGEQIPVADANGGDTYLRIVKRVFDQGDDKCIVELL